MTIRDPPDWFNKASGSVLDFLATYPIAMTPSTIAYNLEYERSGDHGVEKTIRNAINDLHEHGLIDQHTASRGTTLYSINETGETWVETGSLPDEAST